MPRPKKVTEQVVNSPRGEAVEKKKSMKRRSSTEAPNLSVLLKQAKVKTPMEIQAEERFEAERKKAEQAAIVLERQREKEDERMRKLKEKQAFEDERRRIKAAQLAQKEAERARKKEVIRREKENKLVAKLEAQNRKEIERRQIEEEKQWEKLKKEEEASAKITQKEQKAEAEECAKILSRLQQKLKKRIQKGAYSESFPDTRQIEVSEGYSNISMAQRLVHSKIDEDGKTFVPDDDYQVVHNLFPCSKMTWTNDEGLEWLGIPSHILARTKGWMDNSEHVKENTDYIGVRVGGHEGKESWEFYFDKNFFTLQVPVQGRAIAKKGSQAELLQMNNVDGLFGGKAEYLKFKSLVSRKK